MELINYKIIANYSSAFQASHWIVQLKNRSTEEALRIEYTVEQLLKAVPFLRCKNLLGFDVYARPVGLQYILLDDLTGDMLKELAQIRPCALVETSPKNYQAWLILPNTPPDRTAGLAICRMLAHLFKADPASADPNHVGRLPGYTNRKEKHQLPDGHYPYVRLHKAQYRISTFYPCGGGVLKETDLVRSSHSTYSPSNSEKDFGIACGLIRKGLSDAQIVDYLLAHSPELERRKSSKHVRAYVERTVHNAHRTLKK